MTRHCSSLTPMLRVALRHWRGWLLLSLATLIGGGVQLLQPWPLQLLIARVLAGHAARPRLAAAGLAAAQVAVVVADLALAALLSDLWIRVGQRSAYG